MSAMPRSTWSAAEYLAFERASYERHEFVGGEIFAMTGASENHVLIVTNLTIDLGSQVRKRPCKVYATDMRVRTHANNYVYPDVVIVCGTARFEDDHVDTLLNPTVIIEVLSPTTERYDRGAKFALYRKLESLREYVLVAQDHPRLERYVRGDNGTWLFRDFSGSDATVTLESVGCTLTLADVYDKVTFEPEPE